MVKNRKAKEINKIVKEAIVQYMQKDKLIHTDTYTDIQEELTINILSLALGAAVISILIKLFSTIGIFKFNFVGGIISGILISLFVYFIIKIIQNYFQTKENIINKKLKELEYY